MYTWIVCVGEPTPIDGDNVRLRRMGNLCNQLAQCNNRVVWFTSSFDHYNKKQRCSEDTRIDINNNYAIDLSYVPGYKRNVSVRRIINHKLAGKQIRKRMECLAEKPDIIYASMEPLEVASNVIDFAKANDIPVIIDVRDLWPEIYYEVLPKMISWLLYPYVTMCKVRLRSTMKDTFGITAMSEGFLAYGLKYAGRVKGETDSVFPLAYPNYDYNGSYQNFDRFWNRFDLDHNDFIVAFFGTIGKQFDFEPIIHAAKMTVSQKEIKYVICGTGEKLTTLKNTATSNVVLPGWIDKEAITSLAAKAKVGLAPYVNSINYRLNAPNKFGEYLSAGLPIMINIDGCMLDLLAEYNCGFKYSDGDDLAQKVLTLYNERELLDKLSRNARRLYEEKFNGDINYNKMVDYLSWCCNKY